MSLFTLEDVSGQNCVNNYTYVSCVVNNRNFAILKVEFVNSPGFRRLY